MLQESIAQAVRYGVDRSGSNARRVYGRNRCKKEGKNKVNRLCTIMCRYHELQNEANLPRVPLSDGANENQSAIHHIVSVNT